jgi:c-di-GMP-binding flagellar brake protein YcgR
MDLKSGWMEKRQSERVDATVKVTYAVIPKEALVTAMADSAYRESTADQLPELSKRSATLHAFTRDISVGGMSLVGQESFPADCALQIQLYIPGQPIPLNLLAEVVRAGQESAGATGSTFRAGLKILAINKQDVAKLDRFLLAEKIRMRNAGK